MMKTLRMTIGTRHALRATAAFLLAVTVGTRALRAADAPKEQTPSPEAALGRYTEGGGAAGWPAEWVQIDAFVPKLAKEGRLSAIRRLVPSGQAKYQVLQLTGDGTVERQVIARYLTAEQQASVMPANSVAITPANYKFEYKGVVVDRDRLAYTFRVTPRKKKAGLIKGELWIDAETGLPLRQSGYLVKSPSIWIKRVGLTEDILVRDGLVEARFKRVTVDARFIGRAELVIEERPLSSAGSESLTSLEENEGRQ